MKKKILFLSNFGPYRTGMVVFNQYLIKGLNDVEFIQLETKQWYALTTIPKIIYHRFKASTAYITITDRRLGFVKDLFLILALKLLAYKVIAHSHSGSVATFLDKGYGKCYEILLSELIVLSDRFIPKTVRRSKVHIVENIPTDVFYKNIEAKRKDRIIYVGSLIESKGIIRTLKGFAEFSKLHPRYDMLFLGKFFSPETEKEAQDIIKKYNIADKVTIKYAKSADEVKTAMFESKFMVFPSYYNTEGYPLVLVEAAFCGCYIISTNWRAIPDIVAGLPSKILEGDNIAAQITKHLGDLADQKIDHNKIREIALEKFSKEEFYNKMKSILLK